MPDRDGGMLDKGKRERNPYEVLGLGKGATDAEIKRAYLRLIREYTPERHSEAFKEIRTAYEALRDRGARARTDMFHFNLDEASFLEKAQRPDWDLKLVLGRELEALIGWTSDLWRKDFSHDFAQVSLETVISTEARD